MKVLLHRQFLKKYRHLIVAVLFILCNEVTKWIFIITKINQLYVRTATSF
nr:MAG TPA: hypothetical protein [Caudoviricetes sp.]